MFKRNSHSPDFRARQPIALRPPAPIASARPESSARRAGDPADDHLRQAPPAFAAIDGPRPLSSTTNRTIAAGSCPDLDAPPRRSMIPAMLRRAGGDEPPSASRTIHAVVPDQRAKSPASPRAGDQRQRQRALAGSRRSKDQNAAFADDGRPLRGARLPPPSASWRERRQFDDEAGARAVPRRLVAVVVSPTGAAGLGSGRFTAQIRPPCASTICREIDSPRPEFWPKP